MAPVVLHDRGEEAGLVAVQDRVGDGTLFSWLQATYALDVGAQAEAVLGAEFSRLLNSSDPGRQFGIGHNGLTLLLAWCLDLYQQGLCWS